MISGGNHLIHEAEQPEPLNTLQLRQEIVGSARRTRRGLRISAGALLISVGIHAVAAGGIVVFWRAHGWGMSSVAHEDVAPTVVVPIAERPFLVEGARVPGEARRDLPIEMPRLGRLPEAVAHEPAASQRAESLGRVSLIWEADPGRPQVVVPRHGVPAAEPGVGGGNAGLNGRAAPDGLGTTPGNSSGSPDTDVTSPSGAIGERPGASDGGAGDGPPIPHGTNRPPAYPLASRQRVEEGVVRVRMTVRRDGRVGEVTVVQSAGHAALDKSAVDAVRDWTFEASAGEKTAEQEFKFFIQR